MTVTIKPRRVTTIPLAWRVPPLTQNQLRRLHFYAEAKLKATAKGEALTSISRARVEPYGCAEVALHYQPGTRRRFDADGLSPTIKVVLDALVTAGVLEDDGFAFVPAVTIRIHEPVKGQNGSMWVELREVGS